MSSDKKLNVRLLPGDYTRKVKYDALDNTEKDVQKPEGFFTFPEAVKGKQDTPVKDFLVFYFDDHTDYELVRAYFEIASKMKISHPKLDSIKLVELVRKCKTDKP